MRRPYDYGLPGDISYTPQNRVKELYYGPTEARMRSVPSGSHMAPIGKTVLAGRGMGQLFATPIDEVTGRPVMRAAYEMARLGCATPIGMAALGDAIADRNACLAATGAAVGGSGVASQMHTSSADSARTAFFAAHPRLRNETDTAYATRLTAQGLRPPTADAGWSTGLNIFGALSQTAQAMCGLIQTGSTLVPAGQEQLPSLPPQVGQGAQPETGGGGGSFLSGVPNWAILAGCAAIGGLGAAIIFGGSK